MSTFALGWYFSNVYYAQALIKYRFYYQFMLSAYLFFSRRNRRFLSCFSYFVFSLNNPFFLFCPRGCFLSADVGTFLYFISRCHRYIFRTLLVRRTSGLSYNMLRLRDFSSDVIWPLIVKINTAFLKKAVFSIYLRKYVVGLRPSRPYSFSSN